MEKHLGIGSSLYGEFDISLLVTEQAALLVVYLTLQSQAHEILGRLGQPRGRGKEAGVYCSHSFSACHFYPVCAFCRGQTHELLCVRGAIGSCWVSSHIISLLPVGKAYTWACGVMVLWPSGSGGELAICHQSSGLGSVRRLGHLLFQLIFGLSQQLSRAAYSWYVSPSASEWLLLPLSRASQVPDAKFSMFCSETPLNRLAH